MKGKRIGAVKISEFAGGQSQFWVMMKNGLDYIMDPDQVTFTGMYRYCADTYGGVILLDYSDIVLLLGDHR